MTLLRTTLALMLVMVAVLLTAGCITSPGFDNQTQTFPKEKYVFVEHMIHEEGRTITGVCLPLVLFDGPTYFFDEQNGELSAILHTDNRINESLKLFYASGKSASKGGGGGVVSSASPVYSLPYRYSNAVTLNSVTDEGVVYLQYLNNAIELKPKERLVVNTTRVVLTYPPTYDGTVCTEEIITTDSFYNAGFFDKNKIKPKYFGNDGKFI